MHFSLSCCAALLDPPERGTAQAFSASFAVPSAHAKLSFFKCLSVAPVTSLFMTSLPHRVYQQHGPTIHSYPRSTHTTRLKRECCQLWTHEAFLSGHLLCSSTFQAWYRAQATRDPLLDAVRPEGLVIWGWRGGARVGCRPGMGSILHRSRDAPIFSS